MGEIISEIMSEKYREKYREKYSEMMVDLYEFLIELTRMGAVRRRAVSDGGRPFCRCCSTGSESCHCRRRITSSSLVQFLQSRYTSESEPYL